MNNHPRPGEGPPLPETAGEPQVVDQGLGPEVEAGPDPPMIYVASLADYNEGVLHGEWIDVCQELPDIHDRINQMLDESPSPGRAGEYAIHDHQGFGSWGPSEYERIDVVHAVAEAIQEHGQALADWIAYTGGDPMEAIETFEEAYLGTYDSMVDYARELVGDIGCEITVDPPGFGSYVRFDHEALANDLEHELYAADAPGGQVHIFRTDI